jgi:hypothetical protein|tara:strand:- start:1289 stop:1417 length:129 start_codon:yes stop_codon:yes gene_type:complete
LSLVGQELDIEDRAKYLTEKTSFSKGAKSSAKEKMVAETSES